jgi:hypothetical protein
LTPFPPLPAQCRPPIRYSRRWAPIGTKMSYSSAASTHEGIDMLADHGILYRGELERLHAMLVSLRA